MNPADPLRPLSPGQLRALLSRSRQLPADSGNALAANGDGQVIGVVGPDFPDEAEPTSASSEPGGPPSLPPESRNGRQHTNTQPGGHDHDPSH